MGYDQIGRRNPGSRSKEEISTCVDSTIWGSEKDGSSGIKTLIFDDELVLLIDLSILSYSMKKWFFLPSSIEVGLTF